MSEPRVGVRASKLRQIHRTQLFISFFHRNRLDCRRNLFRCKVAALRALAVRAWSRQRLTMIEAIGHLGSLRCEEPRHDCPAQCDSIVVACAPGVNSVRRARMQDAFEIGPRVLLWHAAFEVSSQAAVTIRRLQQWSLVARPRFHRYRYAEAISVKRQRISQASPVRAADRPLLRRGAVVQEVFLLYLCP